jgi:hypothetical protein
MNRYDTSDLDMIVFDSTSDCNSTNSSNKTSPSSNAFHIYCVRIIETLLTPLECCYRFCKYCETPDTKKPLLDLS